MALDCTSYCELNYPSLDGYDRLSLDGSEDILYLDGE